MSALIQQTPEWLEMRKEKIGASDAPIIMGVSPWKTPYRLWEEKTDRKEGGYTSSSMKRGIDLENSAREHFIKLTGITVDPQVIMHPQYEWMMASLDGISDCGQYIVEIKCPGKEDHEMAVKGQIPDKYYPQLQHQLEVCNLDMAYYFSFDGKDGVIIECQRDKKYIKGMLKKELEFFECVKNDIAPKRPIDDYQQKTDDMWQSYAQGWLVINEQLSQLEKQVSQLEKQEKEMRESLLAMCQGENCIGHGISVAKSMRKGNIDYSAIQELKNIDLEQYRKESIELWKITKL